MNRELTPLLIRNGRIIDPGRGISEIADLLVEGGRIAALAPGIAVPPGQEVIDASGMVVCPGFIDLHCHLREPGFEDKETIATGTRAAAAGGFVAVCCMANTAPPIDNRAVVELVKQKAAREGIVQVFPLGCVTRGRRGKEICDLAELASAGVVAFSDDGDPVADSKLMQLALEQSRTLSLPIVAHCEDKALSRGGVVNEGRVSLELGVKGIPAKAEKAMVARDLALAKLTGARLHIAHVSTCGSVELIRRAREEGVAVTAEVTPHHLTLTEERVRGGNTSAKVNPPLRTEDDLTCLVGGLRDGVIDAVATDHAPHTLADKECSLEAAAFGISGLETALGSLMSLVHSGEIDLATLISRLTCEPAKVIGKEGELGVLKVGVAANITIFDPHREWTVDRRKFLSRGKNTPFQGVKFQGRVMATIVGGRVVYKDASLKGNYARISSPLTGED